MSSHWWMDRCVPSWWMVAPSSLASWSYAGFIVYIHMRKETCCSTKETGMHVYTGTKVKPLVRCINRLICWHVCMKVKTLVCTQLYTGTKVKTVCTYTYAGMIVHRYQGPKVNPRYVRIHVPPPPQPHNYNIRTSAVIH